MELLLLRHPATVDVSGLCIGQTDTELKEQFQCSEKLISFLKENKLENIYSSDLMRCNIPGKTIAHELNLNLTETATLREIHFGLWENKSWEFIEENFNRDFFSWMEDIENNTPTKGENYPEFKARVLNFLNEAQKQPEKNILLVTHAGVIRLILSEILQIPYVKSFQFQIDHLSFTKIILNENPLLNKIIYTNYKILK